MRIRVKVNPVGRLLLVTAFLPMLPLLAGDPKIDVSPLPVPIISTFDPAHPPSVVQPGEDAATTFDVGVTTTPYTFSFDGTNAVVTGLPIVHVTGFTRIYLPNNADPALKSHENGHADLFQSEFLKNAARKAKDAFDGFVGMTFVGVGATAALRSADAQAQIDKELQKRVNQVQASISDQGDKLNEKYDDLTSHGTSQTVDTAAGEKAATKEFALAQPAGSGSYLPSSGPLIASAGDGSTLVYDPFTASLSFQPGSVAFSSFGSLDPILGYDIGIDPFHLVGLQDNGTVLLSDTAVHVGNGQQNVLNGYLVELAYMPSNLPGFAGMIQGFFDVPPDFTGAGIDNSIGSPFLSGAESLIDNPAAAFWFYTNQPLLDSQGQPLALSTTGELVLGQAVPEPSTFSGMLVGIFLSLWAISRARSGRASTECAQSQASAPGGDTPGLTQCGRAFGEGRLATLDNSVSSAPSRRS